MMDGKTNAITHLRSVLGIQNDDRVWLGGHSLEAKKLASALLENNTKPPTGPLDVAFITPESSDEATYFAGKLRDRLVDNGIIWVIVDNESHIENEADSPATSRVTAELVITDLSKLCYQAAETVRLSSDFLAMRFNAARGTV